MKTGQIIILVLVGAILGVAMGYLFPTGTKIVEKPVKVTLSEAELDSIGLAFHLKAQAKVKPKIIVRENRQAVDSLVGAIIALRDKLALLNDSLSVISLPMVWETNEFGPYRDSLRVEADFVLESIDVEFRPRAREFVITILDTVEVLLPVTGITPRDGISYILGILTALLIAWLA